MGDAIQYCNKQGKVGLLEACLFDHVMIFAVFVADFPGVPRIFGDDCRYQ